MYINYNTSLSLIENVFGTTDPCNSYSDSHIPVVEEKMNTNPREVVFFNLSLLLY